MNRQYNPKAFSLPNPKFQYLNSVNFTNEKFSILVIYYYNNSLKIFLPNHKLKQHLFLQTYSRKKIQKERFTVFIDHFKKIVDFPEFSKAKR